MSHESINASSAMPELKMELQQSQLKSHGDPSVSGHEAFVVGLYGVPGSGKSFLLNQLKRELGSTQSGFYEGSDIIASITPGGLDIFQSMEEQEQVHWRRRAIDTIRQDCIESGLTAVVVGHFMFWSNEQGEARPVYTEKDLYIFTHVLYLDVPAEVVEQRRLQDVGRNRPPLSATHLHKWQCEEKTQLRDLCRRHNILFMLVTPHPTLSTKISILLHDFRDHTEKYNLSQAKSRLDDIIGTSRDQLETVLVVDADGTLAAEDTGALFWKNVSKSPALEDRISPLKALYGSQLGYSYTAFRQAVLLYEETADDQEFDALCEDVALAVTMHPEFLSLLQLVVEQKHVGAVVITCGLCRVWEKVLQREGLSKKVKVIGGGRIADGFVVSAAVKAALVARLRETYHIYVWAFGDSPLDLDMLYMANRAVVVAGKEQTRSKTMNAALTHAIDHGGLRAHQAVLPSNASPRLDTTKLPVVKLTERDFVESLLRGRYTDDGLHVLCGTDKNAAKLLATSMRDAAIGGPVPAASASPCRMVFGCPIADRCGGSRIFSHSARPRPPNKGLSAFP